MQTLSPHGTSVGSRPGAGEKIFIAVGLLSTLIGLVTLAALLIDLGISGLPRLNWDFFTSFPSRRASQAGILSAWVGSLLVILVTATVAIPMGVGAGIYLEEYARKNWLTNIIEINVSNLAAVPSIVYGLLALGLFVYGLGTGRSILNGSHARAPDPADHHRRHRESVRAVPHSIREAAYGIGATKGQVTRDHVLPAAVPGVLTGVIIGLSRALGETAPLITIGALTFIAFLPEAPIERVRVRIVPVAVRRVQVADPGRQRISRPGATSTRTPPPHAWCFSAHALAPVPSRSSCATALASGCGGDALTPFTA